MGDRFQTFAFSSKGVNQMHLNEGIGVGLSTANSLVRAMGGNLSVSTFSVGRDFRNVVNFRVCTTEKSKKESFNDDL